MDRTTALRDAVDAVLEAFGAPGDSGYGTPKGDALLALHRARADADVLALEVAGAEKLRKRIDELNWYWNADDPECGYGDPFEILETLDAGEVVPIQRGGPVETRYYAWLPAAPDATDSRLFIVDAPTAEMAETKLADERTRRAALSGDA